MIAGKAKNLTLYYDNNKYAVDSIKLDVTSIKYDNNDSSSYIGGVVGYLEATTSAGNGVKIQNFIINVNTTDSNERCELAVGGLFGYAPIMPVNKFSCDAFINRGGRIPAPIHSFKN